jgi:hypothetical protein
MLGAGLSNRHLFNMLVTWIIDPNPGSAQLDRQRLSWGCEDRHGLRAGDPAPALVRSFQAPA